MNIASLRFNGVTHVVGGTPNQQYQRYTEMCEQDWYQVQLKTDHDAKDMYVLDGDDAEDYCQKVFETDPLDPDLRGKSRTAIYADPTLMQKYQRVLYAEDKPIAHMELMKRQDEYLAQLIARQTDLKGNPFKQEQI